MFKDFELLKYMTLEERIKRMDEKYNPADDYIDVPKDQKFTPRVVDIEITDTRLIARAKAATGIIFQHEVALDRYDSYEDAADVATAGALEGVIRYEQGGS